MLTNQSTSNQSPAFGPVAYPVIALLWEGPTPQLPLQVSSTYLAAMPGTYTMTAKDLNNGCMAVGTKTIIDFRDYPNVNRPNAPNPFILDCGAKSVAITPVITNSASGFSYSWTAVTGATVSGENTPVLSTNMVGRYQIDVVNNLNGCASVGFVDVVNGTLKGEFTPDATTGNAPLLVNFTNQSTSTTGTTSIVSYWNFGNGTSQVTSSVSASPTATFNAPGTYTVTMFVIKGTCMDTVSKEILVEIPSAIQIPNIFFS